MLQELHYRPARREDRKQVYNLYMNKEANPYLVFDEMTEEEFERVFERLLSEGSMVIVEAGGAVAANYHLFPKEYRQSDTVYLATLVVHPSFKRKGLAAAILRHIIDSCRADKKNRLELEVSVNNPNAVALYKKMGFEIEGVIRQSYKIGNEPRYYDDYLMSILL